VRRFYLICVLCADSGIVISFTALHSVQTTKSRDGCTDLDIETQVMIESMISRSRGRGGGIRSSRQPEAKLARALFPLLAPESRAGLRASARF